MRATKESLVSKVQRLSCEINLNQSAESKSQRLSWLSRLSDDIGFLRTVTQSTNRDSAIFRSQRTQAQYAMHECNDNHIKKCYLNGSHRSSQPAAYTREHSSYSSLKSVALLAHQELNRSFESSNLSRHLTNQLKSELIQPTAYGRETQASHNYTTYDQPVQIKA
ncbi:BTB/POZ domain-containing protein [Dorcoceras hygrometricum]|uniref:BTB/POZ domain-containing protein n=1 Tax=Dorcoceras hygrometricum TaxID=472368 RepID=A0A2Z7CNU7_9LAMI|nr:BTB/POZ domain-containing protein [Dorcoceras hygrometricum]